MIIRINLTIIKVLLTYIMIILAMVLTGAPLGTVYYSRVVIIFFIVAVVSACVFKALPRKDACVYASLLTVIEVISMIVNKDTDITHFLGQVLVHFGVMLMISMSSFKNFSMIYTKILAIISGYSIVLTLFFNLFKSTIEHLRYLSFPSAGYWYTFLNLYNIWSYNQGMIYIRNSGFFREPGVFGMHICLGCLLLLSNIDKNNKFNKMERITFLVFCVSGVTTMSTVSVLGIIVLLILYFYKTERITLSRMIIIFFTVILGALVLFRNYDLLFGKFFSDNIRYSSLMDRTTGIRLATKAFLINPFTGIGYSRFQTIMNNHIVTFSLIELAAKYGVLYAMVIILGLIGFIKNVSCRAIEGIATLIVLSFFIYSQGFADSSILLSFEMFSLSYLKIKRKKIGFGRKRKVIKY